MCRCTWGPNPVGKKHGKSEICAPRPAFGTPADTCTIPGAAAGADSTAPSCAKYTAKGTCPADRCIWGGWFCQPLPTGAEPDGTNTGACEKSKTEDSCSASGGDGECRCTWGVHPLGKKYKRPGAKICSPNPEFLTRSDTCVPSDSPPGTLSPAAAAANAEEAGTDVPGGDGTDAQESVPAATSAPTQQCAGYQCDPKKWTGYVAKGGKICGECSAMVNIQVADGTCEGFCKLQGQTCVEGWEDMHLTRRHPYGHNVACDHGDFVRPCSQFSASNPAISRPFPIPAPSPMKKPARHPSCSVSS